LEEAGGFGIPKGAEAVVEAPACICGVRDDSGWEEESCGGKTVVEAPACICGARDNSGVEGSCCGKNAE
jgi:hypothetical protein